MPLRDFIWSKSRSEMTPNFERGSKLFKFSEVSVQRVLREFKRLKRKKATGIDNIPPGLIKDAAEILAKPLTHQIKLSLITGVVPTEWKIAKVISLYKSGPRTCLDNYRPISVLPIFYIIYYIILYYISRY